MDSALRRWSNVRPDLALRKGSIESEWQAFRCPLLALQGVDDAYGTLEQVRQIKRTCADPYVSSNCSYAAIRRIAITPDR